MSMYVTFKLKQTQQHTQLRFEDMYQQLLESPNYVPATIEPIKDTVEHYHTRLVENYDTAEMYTKYNLSEMKLALMNILPRVKALLTKDMSVHYETFFIPKNSGGMRRIDAPKTDLMDLLRDIKDLFEKKLKVVYHDAAYAYVPKRSTVDALIVHQINESKWFLKLDVKDFFPSCNHAFILRQLKQIFPFNILFEDTVIARVLSYIIKLCLLNNTLPQGTPMSPMLTNLIMIPIDFEIRNTFKNFEHNYFVYTRYADDILLSSKYDFNFQHVETEVNKIFKNNNAPFQIKQEKTRYGSSAGRNWNLGLMLNKDNQITIGHKKKQRLKATIFSFMQDFTKNLPWSIIDTQVMIGNISYFSKVEKEYIDHLIDKYSEKFGISVNECIKTILKGHNLDFLPIE